jgi:hypothetical protein
MIVRNVKMGNSELYSNVMRCKKKDRDALLEMVTKFSPLIKKYSYLLNYSDAEQDVTTAFIEVVKNMPLEKIALSNDGNTYILSYIKKSIKNKYILLSKQKYFKHNHEELVDEFSTYHDDFNIECI